MTERIAKRFIISGIVQGVGYRFFAQRRANKIGIRGYVKNLHDGRVEAYAIGSRQQMQAFRNELREGPSFATVKEVAETDEEVIEEYSDGFSVEHDNYD